jgi:hypothetical protein
MQIKLHLDKYFKILDLNLDGHEDILPKHIQLNGKFNLGELDTILSSIDSSILSFGRIYLTEESLEDFHQLEVLSNKANNTLEFFCRKFTDMTVAFLNLFKNIKTLNFYYSSFDE